LLPFGTDVEVLSPSEVRDDLRAVAAEILGCYDANCGEPDDE
jgi:hypothetical protein